MEIKPHLREFEQQRGLLYGVAYRMLGSVGESEDVIQDAYLRWSGTHLRSIDSPAAFLTSVVCRLCIDKLRKRKVEKLNYVGPWLPDPIPTQSGPEEDLVSVESISMAFMVVLEKLNPFERAVFILREAFDVTHIDIAEMLQISACHSRQLLHRAKKVMQSVSKVPQINEEVMPLVNAFLAAAQSGKTESLKSILCEDVIAYSDGGGRASAALIPLVGPEMVTTVFTHLISKAGQRLDTKWILTNQQWGLLAYEGDQLSSVTTFELKDGKIFRIYVMRNPDKLIAFEDDTVSALF